MTIAKHLLLQLQAAHISGAIAGLFVGIMV